MVLHSISTNVSGYKREDHTVYQQPVKQSGWEVPDQDASWRYFRVGLSEFAIFHTE